MSATTTISVGQDSEEAIIHHSSHFYSKLNKILANKDHTAYPLSDEMHQKIIDFMVFIEEGSTDVELKTVYPRGYIYIETYDLVKLSPDGKPILIYRQQPDNKGDLPPLDQFIQVACRSTCFAD
jgi:hypothetical protein